MDLPPSALLASDFRSSRGPNPVNVDARLLTGSNYLLYRRSSEFSLQLLKMQRRPFSQQPWSLHLKSPWYPLIKQ